MKITAPRAVLILAAAFTLIGSVAAVAVPTLSGAALSLAAGDSAAVTCAGPSLAWSAASSTSGTLQCAANPAPTTTTTAVSPVEWWKPGPLTSWQWQLSGTIDTTKPASILGSTVGGWPDERFVDVRALDGATGSTGKTLRQILAARFTACQSKGFDAVETDLDDQYPDSTGFPLTKVDYETFDRSIAADIHGRGMAWFLKNGINGDSFITDLVATADGTVNEECWAYAECDALRPFVTAGKPILNAVYAGSQSTICPKALAFPMATMKKYVDLRAAVIWKCWA